MQQTIDTTEVDERAVVGDVLDDTLDDRAFRKAGQQGLTLRTLRRFEHGTARNDNVVALAVKFDDLEFENLAFIRRGVLDRADIDQRTGQEGTNAIDHNRQTALDLARHQTLHLRGFFERLFKIQPGGKTFGLVAREARFAKTVFQRIDRDFNLAAIVLKFFEENVTF